jgi:BirA family biotin operon repressor/biotin-[acetyl-CoA-carboxylase] ligase
LDPADTGFLDGKLTARWLGRSCRRLPIIGSTNDEAASWARAGAPHGAVVIADGQQKGRGRMGRIWHSPPGESLYFSVVLRPPLAPRMAPPLTLVAAVALAETVRATGARELELKWPNDLLLDGKKLAGILTEMATTGEKIDHVVIGIGVNLHGREFPDDLATRATSLALSGITVERARFAANLCGALEQWYERFMIDGPAPIVAGWKSHARLFGREVTVANGRARATGIAEDLDAEGALLLRSKEGTIVRIVAGELG